VNALRSFRVRSEGDLLGGSIALPFLQLRLPTGGQIGAHVNFALVAFDSRPVLADVNDLEVSFMPSLSRYIEWYVRAGYGHNYFAGAKDASGRVASGAVVEAGFEVRWLPNLIVAVGGVRRPGGYWAVAVEAGTSPYRRY
jgi:hypothetical protein